MASIPAAAPSEGQDTTDEREESRASGHGEAHVDPRVAVPPTSPSETSSFLVGKYLRVGDNFWRAFAVFGVLAILGIIGIVMRLAGGIGDKAAWGYYVAMFSFMLTTASAAPMVAIAPRLANAHWRRPLSRAAEMWSAVGLLSLLWFIPILWVLPPLSDGRRSLWFFDKADPNAVPSYSPHIWTSAAILALVILGLAMLWLSSLPDFASVAKRAPDGSRQKRWAKRMALGWQGTSGQWFMMKHRLGILGALYFMMLVFVHFLISVDFLMTLVPGWIDALYPITHAANALQAAAATMVLTAWVLRTFCGYEKYIGLDQIWGLGKLMFALSLLWFWFWFSSFNVLWYGKKPYEQAVIDLLFTGPYLWIFMATFLMCFVIPLWTLVWNPVRRSLWGAAAVGGGDPDRHIPRPRAAVRSRLLGRGNRQPQHPQRSLGSVPHSKGALSRPVGRVHHAGRDRRDGTGIYGGDPLVPDHELLGTARAATLRSGPRRKPSRPRQNYGQERIALS